jgi:hypothetical protein
MDLRVFRAIGGNESRAPRNLMVRNYTHRALGFYCVLVTALQVPGKKEERKGEKEGRKKNRSEVNMRIGRKSQHSSQE